MTKAYAVDADFSGADMTNAVIDRVDFSNTKLQGVKFVNAVITGSEFAGADLSGADFEDALIGNEDAKRLCAPALPPPPLCALALMRLRGVTVRLLFDSRGCRLGRAPLARCAPWFHRLAAAGWSWPCRVEPSLRTPHTTTQCLLAVCVPGLARHESAELQQDCLSAEGASGGEWMCCAPSSEEVLWMHVPCMQYLQEILWRCTAPCVCLFVCRRVRMSPLWL